jgi:hypothetical protein
MQYPELTGRNKVTSVCWIPFNEECGACMQFVAISAFRESVFGFFL